MIRHFQPEWRADHSCRRRNRLVALPFGSLAPIHLDCVFATFARRLFALRPRDSQASRARIYLMSRSSGEDFLNLQG